MVAYHQLDDFKLVDDTNNGDLHLFVKGHRCYKSLLRNAYPALFISRSSCQLPPGFDWKCCVKSIADSTRQVVSAFLFLMKNSIYIEKCLDACFALKISDKISELSLALSRRERKQKLIQTADQLSEFIQQHPLYRRADVLIDVPAGLLNNQKKSVNDLLKSMARKTGIYNGCGLIDYRQTIGNDTSFESIIPTVERNTFKGKSVILISDGLHDLDLLRSVEHELRSVGANQIVGLGVNAMGEGNQ